MEEDPAACVLAGGALSKLTSKLDGLLIRRSTEGSGLDMPIPWEVKNTLIPLIKQNLESMIGIIRDEEDNNRNSSRAVIRCLTKELRELSYDIHDCADEYTAGPTRDCASRLLARMVRHIRVATKKKTSSSASSSSSSMVRARRRRAGSRPVTIWLSERLKGRLWLLDKMRGFSSRSEEALRRYNSFNRPLKKQRNAKDDGGGGSSSSSSRSGESFGSWSPPPYAAAIHRRVGIHDRAMNTLVAWLKDGGRPELKVVSMVGCGGVGKTTLANELYRGIGRQFECRAFVRASQKPDLRRLLISMLSQVQPHQPFLNRKVPNLIDEIRTHLQDKRYLIVIDDVWARSTWDIVNRALPDGNHCSRILITSELEDVALNCCDYDHKYVYKMKPLSEDNSRKLFYNIVIGPQELCEVSNSIIRKCGGLPLAIVSIASLLASRMGKPEQWVYVDKSLGYGLITDPTLEGMEQVVNLSYSNLPQHLKACLLYLSIFPGDYIIWKDDLVKQWIAEGFISTTKEIWKDDLVKQWIAEGFISTTKEKDEMEISKSYFDELISSRLIHPIHIDGNGEVLSCTMHHMVRIHIMHESFVENFVAAIDHSQTATRFAHMVRRLSLHFGNAEDASLSTHMRLSQVRTLAFWGAFKCVPSITEFRLLQVLILHFWGNEESIMFDLTSISEIFRLRYLQVTCNVTLVLQQIQMLQRLQYLETLKIDAGRGSTIPSDIIHLPRLLHLILPAETNLLNGIGHLTSLHTLGHFDLSTNSIEKVRNLGELTNIQDLQLTCTPMGPPRYLVKQMECFSSVLGKLNNLKCLTLKPSSIVDVGRRPSSMSISCDGLNSVSSPPELLQRLEWLPRVLTFSSLPVWIGHLSKLCILKIGVRELVRNDVDLLKGLPALNVLSLYVRKRPTERIVFSEGGFLVLKYFRFSCSVPCLKFEADAMPNLRKLKLGFNSHGVVQYGLKPAGLDHLSGLKEISAKIGGASVNEPGRSIVELALSDAIRMHPGRPTINIQCVDQMFGDKDDQDIVLQEVEHATLQKQYEPPIEEDLNEQHVALQMDSRDDADCLFSTLPEVVNKEADIGAHPQHQIEETTGLSISMTGLRTHMLNEKYMNLQKQDKIMEEDSNEQCAVHQNDSSKDAKKHAQDRKGLPRWTEKFRIPDANLDYTSDDGFSWRKYRQKNILGAKFPREYYRCTHRKAQGCLAMKQVQRSEADFAVFDVAYQGAHTCRQINTHHPVPAVAPPPSQNLDLQLPAFKPVPMLSVRTSVLEDGYSWRKYGQKEVLGYEYPISYYWCTHRATHGCKATKQVNRTVGDPQLFDISYNGNHTCVPDAYLLPRPEQEHSSVSRG